MPFAFAFAAGSVAVAALPPYDLGPLMPAGIALLYALLARKAGSVRAAFAIGWCFGFGYFLFGLCWIGNALLVEGNPYRWAWPLAVAGLPVLLALFPAAACALTRRIAAPASLEGMLAFVALLAVSEWLRGHILTGFPWNLFGYAWAGTPAMIQTASIGGAYFLTFLTIFWGAAAGYAAISRDGARARTVAAALAILSLGACAAFGIWRLNAFPAASRADTRIVLVQPDIPQEEKWDSREMARHFATLSELSLAAPDGGGGAKTTLVVWPETALSFFLTARKETPEALAAVLHTYPGDAYLLTGLLDAERPPGAKPAYYNSLAVYDGSARLLARHDKSHLVPFGEYIPLQDWIPLEPVARFNGFRTGSGQATVDVGGSGLKISPLICYEIIFPGAVTAPGAERPDLIVNVTNDGWYGDSAGPYQHFAMAVFRAAEEGLPVARAANTGISGVIDPLGRIAARTELSDKGALSAALPAALPTPTLFVFLRGIPFWSACAISLLSMMLVRRIGKGKRTPL